MSVLLAIRIESAPLERLDADLAVAGIFADERPMRGGAGRVDWRLCALVSHLLAQGRIHGAEGEALLVPCFGRLAASRALLLGLGSRANYGEREVRSALRSAFQRGLELGARSLAMAPLGLAPEEIPHYAEALVVGPLEALRRTRVSAVLRLSVPEDSAWAASRALEAVSAGSRMSPEVVVAYIEPKLGSSSPRGADAISTVSLPTPAAQRH